MTAPIPVRITNSNRSDRIVSISAVVVASCALFVSLFQSCETIQHQKLSVLPRIGFEKNFWRGAKSIGIKVMNQGVGPARVDRFQVHVDNVAVKGRGGEMWENALGILGIDEPWVDFFYPYEGEYWQHGFVEIMLGAEQSEYSKEKFSRLEEAVNRVNIEICYCSFYEECWIKQFQPTSSADMPIASCK